MIKQLMLLVKLGCLFGVEVACMVFWGFVGTTIFRMGIYPVAVGCLAISFIRFLYINEIYENIKKVLKS